MRVRLKGIHRVHKRLASGQNATYFYAWRGGPRLAGTLGSSEFIAAFNDAIAGLVRRRTDKLDSILDGFQDSGAFLSLAPRTRDDYKKLLRSIANVFGDFPLAALTDRKARGVFLEWRDGLAKRSRRQADYAWAVLARVLSWALDRGLVDANPCEKGGKLYHGSRGDRVWSEENEAAFMREASPPLRLALMLALWTGQRQGDLLRLPWSAYNGSVIRLKQGKTGARVTVPVGAPLKAALDATRKRGPLILMNTRGVPWTANGFSASWRKACTAARISGLTFHDLRGTAVLRLSLAGCTVPEIATITGHSLRDVQVILDQNYFHRDVALAQSAITKLETARAKKESES
jgi:integrase